MNLIEENPLKLSKISKELGLPVQEISRQLSRLMKVSLVTKNLEGSYIITNMGKNLLDLLPSYQFLSEHFDYFNNNMILNLPRKFRSRIGELRTSSPVDSILVTFTNIERMIQEAEEYIYYMSDQRLLSSQAYFLVKDALDRGVTMRVLEPEGYSAPSELYDKIPEESASSIAQHRHNGAKVDRILPEMDLSLFMSEKEVASLSFPTCQGKFEYIGFSSKDNQFRDWCLDVYNSYWDQAKPRTNYE